ncbi:MAG TPA: MBL fold metallo-hydrolase RNA specificity domain-containing protein, partial [Anaerolineae bacterium]|nr:MBL fold metallo-hydrolase RNA specificity domain-containing protein [Anaerolineae bacterium]
PLRAEVRLAYGYSAHADRQNLLDWARPQSAVTRGAFVIHGDPGPAQALGEGLRALGYQRIAIPNRGETVKL